MSNYIIDCTRFILIDYILLSQTIIVNMIFLIMNIFFFVVNTFSRLSIVQHDNFYFYFFFINRKILLPLIDNER